MPVDVVIVESPTKARTLAAYLGPRFRVLSSRGHVRDLPEDELGVDIHNGFAPKWVIRNRRVVAELREKTRDAKVVYLATDPDREGEAIAYDLMELLQDGHRFARILLHEITPESVRAALQNPGAIDLRKVEAQRARRILDRLVGYQVSPLLARVLAGRQFESLSAGRVQSVALRFICDRELEIQDFVPQPYWEVALRFPTEPPFLARLPRRVETGEELERLRALLAGGEAVVAAVEEERVLRRPSPPFITSTLQQAAGTEFGFSPARTMAIAQELYEGVPIEGKPVGLITYMRTDSVRVAETAIAQAREFIKKAFGKEYLSPRPRKFKNKTRAQDAHEAIRPTDVFRTPESVAPYLTPDQLKLYDLIWRRFLATQMAEGVWRRRKVVVRVGELEFVASTSWMEFPGVGRILELEKLPDEGAPLPDLAPGARLPQPELLVEEKQTEPPRRYTEAGLVKKLEQEGIGRPSTYAQIVSVIQERGYVRRENGSLRPTLLGFIVTDFLRRYFPETVREDFTAQMEADLDRIQEGELTREELLRTFYAWFSPKLRTVEELLSQRQKPFQVLTDVACPKCGAPMEVRFWEGKLYLACSRYPACRSTRDLPPDVPFRYREGRVELAEGLRQAEAAPERRCPACQVPMEVRRGRYGRYLRCPRCGATAPIPTGVLCPACGQGELVERFGKTGPFYACSRYPECTFRVPGKPLGPCPNCEKGVLFEDPRRRTLRCSNPACAPG
ncbi:MAG: type I DNA topoisomerase [Candidatus Bipolaricaulota bacterium]|nr:type I DNA topoisomerase [Candidatus Bipolaricaulota bacterium]